MITLEAIEERFNFKYPLLYRQLFNDKMLDWGQFSPTWFTTVYPVLRESPPLLLFANDFEIIDTENIYEESKAFKDTDDYRNTNPELNFIPFAKSGAGDLYCFYLNGKKGDDIPIVFVWHDSNSVEVKAKNLQDFIFRCMLEAVIDLDEDSLVMDNDFKVNIGNLFKTHSKYLTDKQAAIIKNIYARSSIGTSLLIDDEAGKIINEEIYFEHLDMEFKYQLDC